jgi:DNA modification methylase
MANNLKHFLAKADELAVEVDAIRNAVAILTKYAANDDEAVSPTPPTPTVAKFAHDIITPMIEEAPQIVAAPTDTYRGAADGLIVAALNVAYQSARSIHEAIGGGNAPIGRAAVYQRLQTLTKTHPHIVEQHPTKNEWKAKSGNNAPTDTDIVLPTLPKALVGKPGKVKATVAANDVAIAPPNDAKAPLLIKGDGLAMMRGMADKSVDLVLADLPYGSTGNAFDPVIDVDAWISEMMRIVTDRGAVVNFASLAFSHAVMSAGLPFFKDRLIWEKPKATGHQLLRHMQAHEDIIVLSKGTVVARSKRQMIFNPQGVIEKIATGRKEPMSHLNAKARKGWAGTKYISQTNRPRTVLRYAKDKANGLHCFAKPVALLEYLIHTYTNDGAIIVDPTMGSRSAGIAALNTGRRFIGAENGYKKDGSCIYSIAKARIDAALMQEAA